jgi:membrane protein DedA with SNARE-associated domain
MSQPTPPSPKKPLNDGAKYMSMATYMAVIITLGTLAGRWLDNKFPVSKIPVFTLVLCLFSVVAAIWYFIRDFIKKK